VNICWMLKHTSGLCALHFDLSLNLYNVFGLLGFPTKCFDYYADWCIIPWRPTEDYDHMYN
jgi:hypothetical protein